MIQTVRGMRDLIGTDALLQKQIEEKIESVYASYGYLPLYTPTVENFELFKVKGTSGEQIKDEIYYFLDKSERELALRFEFTSSLARVASSSQLKMPFKRYQIGEVYRYDRPQAKRYRAFEQADADILGVEGLEAELELMFISREVFKKLEIKPVILINSRKLLNDLIGSYANGKEVEVMRVLDKLDKLDKNEIIKMLNELGINGKELVELINENKLESIEQKIGIDSVGVKEVKEFLSLCKENKLDFVKFDARLARGFEYYTGIVFEVKMDNGPSVGGGGRFDKLIEKYGGQKTPAVGISFGVSRLFDYFKEQNTKVKFDGIFLIGLGIKKSELNKTGNLIRNEGINCEVTLKEMNISKAIDFAEKKGFNYIGIIGENELKEKKITIKDLSTGKQEIVKVSEIKKMLV
ncbi:MAG: histidine--tRNA ligase [Candidatus ainarchaeum sp.]|nr:histidine--tRNA ligase [Candidatus ainarchaeum sp.]